MTHEKSSRRLGQPVWTWGFTLVLVLLLASSPAVTRLAVTKTLTVYDLLALRCSIGALCLLPLLVLYSRAISPRLWAMGLVLAFCQGWGMHFATIAGLQFAPAAHASALGPGFVPVWVAIWAWLFYRKIPAVAQRIGIVLIAAGALVLLTTAKAAQFESSILLGDLFFLLSSALAAVYLTYVQRHNLPILQGAALVAVYSGVVYMPWFLLAPVESRLAVAPWPEIVWQSIYQGIGIGVIFILMLNFVVMRIGSQRFAIIGAFVPVLALLFGRWIAGDGISLAECGAIALISGGVLYGAFARASASIQRPIA